VGEVPLAVLRSDLMSHTRQLSARCGFDLTGVAKSPSDCLPPRLNPAADRVARLVRHRQAVDYTSRPDV
jgi:hypothetical protein